MIGTKDFKGQKQWRITDKFYWKAYLAFFELSTFLGLYFCHTFWSRSASKSIKDTTHMTKAMSDSVSFLEYIVHDGLPTFHHQSLNHPRLNHGHLITRYLIT